MVDTVCCKLFIVFKCWKGWPMKEEADWLCMASREALIPVNSNRKGCSLLNFLPDKVGTLHTGHGQAEARSLVKTWLYIRIPRKVFKHTNALALFPAILI